MKLSEAKVKGAFSVKAYVGTFFPERTRDEFASEEGWDEYLESIKRDEWIELREPTTEELGELSKAGFIPEGSLKGVDSDTVIKIIENEGKSSKEQTRTMRKVMQNCIISSSFTDDSGEPANPADVWKILVSQSTKMYTSIMRVWVDSFSPLAD